MIDRKNYEKFINVSEKLNISPKEGLETFTFDLDGLARVIDVAFIEGRITELTQIEGFEDDSDVMEKIQMLQEKLKLAMPDEFDNVEEEYVLEQDEHDVLEIEV